MEHILLPPDSPPSQHGKREVLSLQRRAASRATPPCAGKPGSVLYLLGSGLGQDLEWHRASIRALMLQPSRRLQVRAAKCWTACLPGKSHYWTIPVATARKVNMHSLDWAVSLLLRTCTALRNSCRVEVQYPTRAIPSQPPCPTRRVLLTAIYR